MIDAGAILACVLGPLWVLQILFAAKVFWSRKNHDSIKYRSPGLTLVALCTLCILGAMFIVRLSHAYDFPCFLVLWFTQLGYPIIYLCILGRSLRFLFLYRLSEAKLAAALNTRVKPRIFKRSEVIGGNIKKRSSEDSGLELQNLTYASDTSFPSTTFPLEENWYYKHRRILGSNVMGTLIGIIILVHIIILMVVQVVSPRFSVIPMANKDCMVGWEWIPHRFFVAFYTVLIILLILMLRTVSDAYGIRRELIIMCSISTTIDIFLIIFFSVPAMQAVDPEIFSLAIALFPIAVFYYYMVLNPTLETFGFTSVFQALGCRSPQLILTSSMESFEILLRTPSLFEQFKLFAVKDFTVENVLFYEHCCRIHELASNSSSFVEELQEMYSTFIANDSRFMVNLNGTTLRKLKRMFAEGRFEENMYDDAQREVKDLMFRNTYPRYLQTRRNNNLRWDTVAEP
ncbi:regulator of G protein signaling superfamily [Basidiobolus meristosporus CBS 931.73]|uniref:Regulator of G protein signaling superfamily n=1 Tax=Basidiobolus meristosporus CBS 931.73 TaxID=1314790 RepID=A0A1Y1W712_9FUNG|nr:regulator of G protein signaling superfamily [Basidiobolus meristosporus CBS 931.73]ORX99100.1 regulator of G protein signaling superfamily [Basidiobolus meristosporus CBS 931.73]|eukprot:ORX69329.1 regulator of G protein signaling superfamily [Basidiobolus meristosporus CBS 931.73]